MRRMIDRMVELGAGRAYFNEPITRISRGHDVGYYYELESYLHLISAKTVILAVPGIDYSILQGDIVDAIRETKYFNAYLPDHVVIVGQVWPNRWWENSGTGFTCGQAVTQDGSNSYAHIFCPTTPYEVFLSPFSIYWVSCCNNTILLVLTG
jgi:hypothetical protein